MLFNSIHFLIFFPVILIAYFLVPHRFRWILLLAASYYFYMCWIVEYVLLIVVSTLVDYIAGISIEKAKSVTKKRLWLSFSLVTNLAVLFSFKYFNFFSEMINQSLTVLNVSTLLPYSQLLLPIGISFYTFQSMGYTIDVYRGQIKPEKHLAIFCSFLLLTGLLASSPL